MTAPAPFHFQRTDLARRYTDALLGRGLLPLDAGLFLAAPRRTGKSTFLRADLIPLLESEGVLAVYVDLWEDQEADPGALIAEAITEAREALASGVRKAARQGGVRSVKAFGVTVDFEARTDEAKSLSKRLRDLSTVAGQPIAIVIDEAQHAIDSPEGMAAMFALKAARDALNQDRERAQAAPPLMLVMTGSNRDKLSQLVHGQDQPFLGAQVVDLPLLDGDYVAALVAELNGKLAQDNQFDLDDVAEAFALLGARPELLREVLTEYALSGPGAQALGVTVRTGAARLRERLWADHDATFGELTPLQREVLRLILTEGARLAPFSDQTKTRLAARLEKPASDNAIRKSLSMLRKKGLIWRTGRGSYAPEDQGMIDWLAARSDQPE